MFRPRLIALLLALGALLVYLPVTGFNFVDYDDTDYVTENNMVNHGLTWTGIRWAFTAFHAGNWHPLTWLVHMLDCQLFAGNAGCHHLVNVLFHAANVALLFLWIHRITGKIGPAAFVAALFAWHPLHVESVAWISELKDVLSTFFALLTLHTYTRYALTGDRRSLVLALALFILGLLAKPMLVTLPFVLLLLDVWPFTRLALWTGTSSQSTGMSAAKTRSLSALVIEKLPFFLLAAASCVITFFAQRQGEAVISLTKVPFPLRLENAIVSVASYLQKIVWPSDLCVIYPLPATIPILQVIISLAVLVAITVFVWRNRSRYPYCLIGWLWFLGTLIPVIGLVQVGAQSMADRYTYLPSIGLFLAVILLLNDLLSRRAQYAVRNIPNAPPSGHPSNHPLIIVQTGAAVLICAACILATEKQLPYWTDSETLFRRALAVTKDNPTALINLGVALDVQGRFDEALTYYRQAEKLPGANYQLHNNLGNLLDKLGNPAESADEYRLAIRQRPSDPVLHNAFASELAALGQYDQAFKEFDTAEQLDPHYPWSHLERAKLFFRLGRDAEALPQLNAALTNAPDNYQILATVAHYLAANENADARNGSLALTIALKANDLSGRRQPMVFDILAMALAETGDFTNAQLCAQSALDLATAAQLKSATAISNRLDLYQHHQPWHESFLASTNSPPR